MKDKLETTYEISKKAVLVFIIITAFQICKNITGFGLETIEYISFCALFTMLTLGYWIFIH